MEDLLNRLGTLINVRVDGMAVWFTLAAEGVCNVTGTEIGIRKIHSSSCMAGYGK